MTAARAAGVPATLTVEQECDRRCQVEFDLSEVHVRYTLGQMLAIVETAHTAAHTSDPVRVYRYRAEVLVRAGTLAGAA